MLKRIIFLIVCSMNILSAAPMSQEKFLKYKELAPETLDILNKINQELVTCIQNEKSTKNIEECIQKFNQSPKPIETMITKLLPSYTRALCKRDNNGELEFVWSEQNYNLIISGLHQVIEKHRKNKKCILESQTVEDYAQCLSRVNF